MTPILHGTLTFEVHSSCTLQYLPTSCLCSDKLSIFVESIIIVKDFTVFVFNVQDNG